MEDKIVRSEVDLSKPLPFLPERLAEMVRMAETHLENIDESDAPYLGDEAWEHAERGLFYRGVPQSLQPVLVATDILLWFSEQGDDYQFRINEILRKEMHRAMLAAAEEHSEPLKKSA